MEEETAAEAGKPASELKSAGATPERMNLNPQAVAESLRDLHGDERAAFLERAVCDCLGESAWKLKHLKEIVEVLCGARDGTLVSVLSDEVKLQRSVMGMEARGRKDVRDLQRAIASWKSLHADQQTVSLMRRMSERAESNPSPDSGEKDITKEPEQKFEKPVPVPAMEISNHQSFSDR